MRLLKFNNQLVDIDEQTAIGIDFQAYDVAKPGSRKVSVSNNFTIPKTAANMRMVGFAGNPQSIDNSVYDKIVVDYFNDNMQLIKKGSAQVTEVGERISVLVYEKESFWELMADYLWPDFLVDFISWMQTEKSLPSATSPFVGTFQQFIDGYINTTEGLILPFFVGNLARYDVGGSFLEDTTKLWLKRNEAGSGETTFGGHWCIYSKTIFEFIESKYGVNLSVTDNTLDYNIFEDAVASVDYVRAGNISIEYTPTGFYFSANASGVFSPEKTTNDKESKSLYDFVNAWFQRYNCIIDKAKTTDGTTKYIVRRFDDITKSPVIDLSGKMSGDYKFKPIIDGIKQTGYIKFSSVYEGGDELTNAKKVTCYNKNIDPGGTDNAIFSIDSYIPGSIVLGGDVVPDLSPNDSLKTFEFFISQGLASTTIKAMEGGDERTANATLQIARTYDLNSEYVTYATMVQYPKAYTIKRWMSLADIYKIVYFARYWIKELNGYFFINKISGYNPQKSQEATTIELIKLPPQGN